jgi:hypothetical protein
LNLALSVLTCNAPQAAIRTVRSSGLPLDRCIIVDNGSCMAADAELMASPLGECAVSLSNPRGISYCMNLGLRLPAEEEWTPLPEWTILTQDDVEFDADWRERFESFVYEHPHALQVNLAYPKCTYSCIAIHHDLVGHIGWWDERFTGMFYEDDDWHLRLTEFAGYPHGTRAHEKDAVGIFKYLPCALHGGRVSTERAKDRARFKFEPALTKAENEKFFHEKWERVEKCGWTDKGLPGRYARKLPEDDPYPRTLLGEPIK